MALEYLTIGWFPINLTMQSCQPQGMKYPGENEGDLLRLAAISIID